MVTRFALRLVGTFLVGATMACVEGPFAHSNPNDPEYPGTLTIAASRDTVSPANPIVVLEVVGNPRVTGYEPVWVSSDTSRLVHLGSGVFRIRTAPFSVEAVNVQAFFLGASSAIRTIYVSPSP